MKIKILIIVLILLIVIGSFIYYNNPTEENPACIKEVCFNVEIADTYEEKSLGLGKRDFLPIDSGMLFPYPEESIPGFWMKDMRFPLDIIWINSELEITGIEQDIQPCGPGFCPAVYPDEKIVYVLEINAGLSERYGFKEGDVISFKG